MLLNPYRFGPGIDVDFAKVKLLLHMEGANNATSSTDSSSSPKTLTFNGNAKLSTAQKPFGASSLYIDGGATSYVTIADTADLEMGSGDYTLSLWAYFIDGSPGGVFMKGVYTGGPWSEGFGMRFLGSYMRFYYNTTNSNAGEKYNDTDTISFTTGTWNHFEMCVSGGIGYCFVNGTLISFLTGVGAITDSTAPVIIGRFPFSSVDQVMNGYLKDIRLIKGQALHTTSFTPPTGPYPDS